MKYDIQSDSSIELTRKIEKIIKSIFIKYKKECGGYYNISVDDYYNMCIECEIEDTLKETLGRDDFWVHAGCEDIDGKLVCTCLICQ